MTNIYSILTIFLTFAIALTYLNAKFIKMQTTSAIMVGSMALSLFLLILNYLGISTYADHFERLISKLHFHDLLINGMLSFLLFAGALTIDWEKFVKQKWEILVLSCFSTLASVALVSVGIYYLLLFLNYPIPYTYCLLFGALISPTDPIAVLGMLSNMKAPKSLTTIIAGESLFNDGVGIVIFVTAYQIAFANHAPTLHGVALLFVQQAFGGIVYGALLGYCSYHLIQNSKDHKLHVLITIAVTTGGYSVAQMLNISGPLAMVVAGIFIGNACRKRADSLESHTILENFWEIVDQVLNALLFLLIGFEVLLMTHHKYRILACLLSIVLVLMVRAITVTVPMVIFKRKKQYSPGLIPLLIWGGLRGGLAVALVLTLPDNQYRGILLSMTYAIVVFAILVQSTTVKGLIEKTKQGAG